MARVSHPYDAVYIQDDGPAFVRIHSNSQDAYGCITSNYGVVVFIAHVFLDELSVGAACLDDVLDVLQQALIEEPALTEAVVGHLGQMKVRRRSELVPVLDPVAMLRWVAAIDPDGHAGDARDESLPAERSGGKNAGGE